MFDSLYLSYYLAAWLVGSIPTGYLAAKIMKKQNIFLPGELGPMNAGEVFEILGLKVGILVTFLDFLKGYLSVSVLINALIGPQGHLDWRVVSIGAVLVVLGHCSSPWLGFRGGRGFATSFGVLMCLLPIPAILSGIVWASLAFWGLSTRPGALSAAGAMPIFSLIYILIFDPAHVFYLYIVAFLSLLILFEYRRDLKKYAGLPPKSNH